MNNSIHLANVLSRTGREEEALQLLREGVTVAKQLVDDFPTLLEHQITYADVLLRFTTKIMVNEPDEGRKGNTSRSSHLQND